MEVETTPAMLEAAKKHGVRVKYLPNVDLGQILNLVPLILALIGGVAAYYGMMAMTEAKISEVKTVNALQDERIAVIQRQAAEQKAEITKSLIDINSEVKAVNNSVQTLSMQVQIATTQQQQQRQKPTN